MMNQVSAQPAVTVVERKGVDRAVGQNRRGDNRIKLPGGIPVESDHPLYQLRQIIRPGTDMGRDWHARIVIAFTNKTVLVPKAHLEQLWFMLSALQT